MRRPMMSWATITSHMSGAMSFTSSLLSTSHSSTTTGASILPSGLLPAMPLRASTCRTILLSASSAASPSAERHMIALAECTDTLSISCSMRGLPDRKITFVPRSRSPPWRHSTDALRVSSIDSLSFSESTTTQPPPSDSLARAICWMIASDLSFHPSMSVWPLSMTLLLPLRRSSTFSPMLSLMIPIINANTSMPPIVMLNATSRTMPPSESACVPGSATKVHDSHTLAERLPPLDTARPTAPARIRKKVTPSRTSGLAHLLVEK
mmetsp:Transcript_4912/g.11451  ORF Transcript_4912/g.11451 Transcript_4912/m.11451 type:complete len:266 (-) Transcript_4912:579-1376(-)